MPNEFVLLILRAVRTAGNSGRTLESILREISPWEPRGRLPGDSAAAVMGGALSALLSNGLISMTSKDKPDLEKLVLSIDDSIGPFSYQIVPILQAIGEENINVRITDKLAKMQALLGFSLTDLIRNTQRNALVVAPFFGRPKEETSTKSDVFVLMPFLPEMKPIYEDHILKACAEANMSCRRADDFFHVGHIMEDVWSAICQAKWIIADCTGRNPNVFYEMGIAHTVGKKVILIAQSEEDVPFDIRHVRYLEYQYTPRGMKRLEDSIAAVFKQVNEIADS